MREPNHYHLGAKMIRWGLQTVHLFPDPLGVRPGREDDYSRGKRAHTHLPWRTLAERFTSCAGFRESVLDFHRGMRPSYKIGHAKKRR